MVPTSNGRIKTRIFLLAVADGLITLIIAADGPMRVPFIRWRTRGGRLA